MSPPFFFTTCFFLSAFGLGAVSLDAESLGLTIESQDQPVTLVELYSSEGCSSCPPAEAWVSQLKNDPRLWKQIVPVVFHVDYWDGLGWPDRFARKAYTQRQRDYQALWGSNTVYTPEFIVNGREWHEWFEGGSLPLRTASPSGKLRLLVHSNDTGVQAEYTPAVARPSVALDEVHVAWLGLNIASDVKRGENGGRQLVHDFVVLDFQSQPLGPGQDGIFRVELPPPAASSDQPAALAAWVTTVDGAILQIAGGWVRQNRL